MLLVPLHCFSSSAASSILSSSLLRNRKFSSLCTKSPFLTKSPSLTRSTQFCKARLITSPDSFEVGRLIGSYGFMNVTSVSIGIDLEYSLPGNMGQLKVQDVGEGGVKLRLYEGRIAQGSHKGTPVVFKVYPGQRAGGIEAHMMAANELNTHSVLQSSSKGICQNLLILVGGFETKTGEQWLAFRNDGKYSAADYAKIMSERISKGRSTGENYWNRFEQEQIINRRRYFSSSKGICQNLLILVGGFETKTGEQWLAFRNDGKYSAADYAKFMSERISKGRSTGENYWNRFEQEQIINCRRYFVIKLLRGAISGLAYMHDHDRLHQSLGPSSIVLNTITEKDAAYLVPRLRDLAFSVDIRYEAGLLFAYLAFVPFCEAGVMDGLSLQRLLESTFRLDLDAAREYCLADDRLEEAVKFLDLGDGAGWQLLQMRYSTIDS